MPFRRLWTVGLLPLRVGIASLIYLAMRAAVRFPFRWQLAVGKRMGRLARVALPHRRRIVDRNLEVCFPEMSAEQRKALCKAHFESLGAAVAELSMAWFGSSEKILSLIEVEGESILRDALAKGRGVIIYCVHYTTFEFFGPVFAAMCPRLCGMFKEQRNPVMNIVMHRGRMRHLDRLFSKDKVRDMLRELAANSVVWYASDQFYDGKGAELIPFFGEPAMTNTAISRIARATGAVVLTMCSRRLEGTRYKLWIGGPLDGFPSDDPSRDVLRLTKTMESYIRECPEQYWWVHKRFKGRPPPYPDIYA